MYVTCADCNRVVLDTDVDVQGLCVLCGILPPVSVEEPGDTDEDADSTPRS